jgi:hypothetical protein
MRRRFWSSEKEGCEQAFPEWSALYRYQSLYSIREQVRSSRYMTAHASIETCHRDWL